MEFTFAKLCTKLKQAGDEWLFKASSDQSESQETHSAPFNERRLFKVYI